MLTHKLHTNAKYVLGPSRQQKSIQMFQIPSEKDPGTHLATSFVLNRILLKHPILDVICNIQYSVSLRFHLCMAMKQLNFREVVSKPVSVVSVTCFGGRAITSQPILKGCPSVGTWKEAQSLTKCKVLFIRGSPRSPVNIYIYATQIKTKSHNYKVG